MSKKPSGTPLPKTEIIRLENGSTLTGVCEIVKIGTRDRLQITLPDGSVQRFPLSAVQREG